MDWTTYDALMDFNLWHQRLGHVQHKNIEKTIQHATGLENAIGRKFKRDNKIDINVLPACWVRVHLRIIIDLWEPAPQPLGREYMDIYSSSVRQASFIKQLMAEQRRHVLCVGDGGN